MLDTALPASGRDSASPSGPSRGRHPGMRRAAERRAADAQLRLADRITAFAGSMTFVYLHVVLFGLWMLVAERSPWPTLTLVVSLEAIFLSTFVMIGQNRQAAFQQAKADHDYLESEQELHLNTDLTRVIHQLTADIHSWLGPQAGPGGPAPDSLARACATGSPGDAAGALSQREA